MNRNAGKQTFAIDIMAFLFWGRGWKWWKAVGAMISTALPFHHPEGSSAEFLSSSSLHLKGMEGGDGSFTAQSDVEVSSRYGNNLAITGQLSSEMHTDVARGSFP